MIKELYKKISNIVENHPFNIGKHLKISHRLYQSRIAVVDITDGYLRFYLDIGFNNDNTIFIKHGVRNSNTERVIRNTQQNALIQSNTIRYKAIQYDTKQYEPLVIQAINDWLAVYLELYRYKVSVIIPTYNRARSITKLLKSINEQTIDKDSYEVIFVDDGSHDDTEDVIKKFMNEDIHYQYHKLCVNSGGASIPRNLGNKLARGEYTIYIDSDDNIYPYTINEIINFVDKTNCDICYFKVKALNGRTGTKSTFRYGTVEEADVLQHFLLRTLAPYKCIRTSLIKFHDISFPNMRSGEDAIFILACLSNAFKVSILADKDYYDLHVSDEYGLTNNNGSFSRYEKLLPKFTAACSAIAFSNSDYIYKLKVFNGYMSRTFDDIINTKNCDNVDLIRSILKFIYGFNFIIIEDNIKFSAHRELYKTFKLHDIYGVCH